VEVTHSQRTGAVVHRLPAESDLDVTFDSWPVSHSESKSSEEASWPAVHGFLGQN
jgi:hypothetical protein